MYIGNRLDINKSNFLGIKEVSSDYTVHIKNDLGYVISVDTTISDVTITLPELIWDDTEDGFVYFVKKSDNSSNKVFIEAFSGQTINEAVRPIELSKKDNIAGFTTFYGASSGDETWHTFTPIADNPDLYQDDNALFDSIAAQTTTAMNYLYTTSSNTFAVGSISNDGLTLLTQQDAPDTRTLLSINDAALQNTVDIPVLDTATTFTAKQIFADGNSITPSISFSTDSDTGFFLDSTHLFANTDGTIALSVTDTTESTAQNRLNISSGTGNGKTTFAGTLGGNGNDAGTDTLSSLSLSTSLDNYHIFSSNTPSRMSRVGTDGSVIEFYHGELFLAGSIDVDVTDTYYTTVSDYRLKEDVQPLENALDIVNSLNPVYFKWKSDTSKTVGGFLAHEVKEILPDIVIGDKDGDIIQTIDQTKIIPYLVAAYQEAKEKLKKAEEEFKSLGKE